MRRSTSRAIGLAVLATVVVGVGLGTVSTTAVAEAGSPGGQPTLAQMDAAGDHAMGASVAAHAQQTSGAAGKQMLASPRSAAAAAAAGGPPPGRVQGMDVSAWQPSVDFAGAYRNGARFAYVKATEGVTYTSRTYVSQYNASKVAGIIRGGYAYAQPSQASGTATANFFLANGGGWSADGYTLPPLLDIEYGSASQGTCYGLSQAAMVQWIHDFSATVHARLHRFPAIYTTTDWWKRCTGNSAAFPQNPLFVALYPVNDFTTPGAVGASWGRWTFWQWASSGVFPGDQDVTVHSVASLRVFATRTE